MSVLTRSYFSLPQFSIAAGCLTIHPHSVILSIRTRFNGPKVQRCSSVALVLRLINRMRAFLLLACLLFSSYRRGFRGQSPLPGFGVSPKNLFFLFLLAAAGGEQGKEALGTPPQTPAGRTLHPLS